MKTDVTISKDLLSRLSRVAHKTILHIPVSYTDFLIAKEAYEEADAILEELEREPQPRPT